MPLRGLSSRVSVAGRMAGPAEMNRWITFCNPSQRNADGSGGSTSQPSAAFSCWAAIYAIAGEEIDKQQQIGQKVSHIVVINYTLGVLAGMTIQYIDGGLTRTFQIADITDPDEQRWQLKIFCFEMGTNAGGSS